MSRPATLPDCGCGGACPCSCAAAPWPTANPPGLPAISYRVGDFTSFRQALVAHLSSDVVLAPWRPSQATGDLGLQILDWWSYLADILTFYNERAVNQAYLRTADRPESVNRLISVLGYRPRPGIGATVTLAALAASPAPITIPAGFAVASKATPTVPSQTFEITAPVSFAQPTSVPQPAADQLGTPSTTGGPPPGSPAGAAEVPAHPQLVARGGVLVAKTPSKVAVGDQLILLRKGWQAGTGPQGAWLVSVTGTVPETDPHGVTNTRVLLDSVSLANLEPTLHAAEFHLVRTTRADHLASLPQGATVITDNSVILAGPDRALTAGDPLLITALDHTAGSDRGTGYAIVQLKGYDEQVWYANADKDTPTTPPAGTPPAPPPPPVPLIVASLTVAGDLTTLSSLSPDQVSVQSGAVDVGTLLDTPVSLLEKDKLPSAVTLPAPVAGASGNPVGALVTGADGNGVPVNVTATPGSRQVSLSAASGGTPPLVPPLRLLFDLLTLTRGKTVAGELLGTGDATAAGQDFTLSQSPVTYLSDPRSQSGDGYSSTITLRVNGIAWREVPMLYGQAPDATVFCTREDESGKTHVITGDGLQGARLPSGAPVTADYRVGSGAAVPAPGALTTILTPVANLRAVANPVAPYGGNDPDLPAKIRSDAPASVLTFGRAVSVDDYAVVAASAGGVSRADAVLEWDPGEQRPVVVVYVGDDDGVVASARAALNGQVDPNRPFVVRQAVQRSCSLRMELVIDGAYDAATVLGAVTAALIDPSAGLFAPGVLNLSEILYRSRVEEAALVPGVLTVHRLRLRYRRPSGRRIDSSGPRFDPGPGGYFELSAARLHLHQAVSHD
jgi:hypothetical protein